MLTRHALRAQTVIVAALSLAAAGLVCMPVRAQSLADVAKKEEERRQKVATPTKVYTNKDLKAPSGPAAPVPPTHETPAGDAAKDSGTDAKTKTSKSGEAVDKDPVKGQAFWFGKLKALEAQLEQDQAYADAMQTRINSLTTDFVNRDDPAQRGRIERDRQKALADLARLKTAIDDDRKAIANLHEDARRAGVPPGWLR